MITAAATSTDIAFIVPLVYALLMGLLIGIERTRSGAEAGMRTYALIALGSALFVTTSAVVAHSYDSTLVFDPLRIPSNIVVGIGFLGAGVIFVHDKTITGLTTAAGIWVTAGIGMAAGFGHYLLAAVGTFLTIFTLGILHSFEQRYFAHTKNRT